MMLNIILISGLLFIMLLFVYNGNLIKKFNKKERLRIVIILLFGFTFIVLFKNKDNLMNRFNKKESFSIGASLTQRFTSPNVPDVNVEISDLDLLEAGFRLDVDGNPVNATSGSRLDAVRIDQLAQMFIQRVRDADPDFPVNNVNNFRFDPSRRQIDTEARTITNTTGMTDDQIELAMQRFQTDLGRVNLDLEDIQNMPDAELDELINDLFTTYRSSNGDGFPPNTPEEDQLEFNLKLDLMMNSAASRRANAPANAARQAELNAAPANAAVVNPAARQAELNADARQAELNAAARQTELNTSEDGVVDDPGNLGGQEPPGQQGGSNNRQELTRNISNELTESGTLPPGITYKQEMELQKSKDNFITKQEGLSATKLRLNRKGKSMNSLEIHAHDHPNQAAVASKTRKGLYALGTGTVAAVTTVGGMLLSVAEKAGNLLEKIIEKREILMRNGVLTPEMVLNLSWDDLVDIIAEYFYGDMLAEGGTSIDAILSGGPGTMSTEGGNQR